MKHRAILHLLLALSALWASSGCSPVRFLDEDETILSSVSVKSTERRVKAGELRPYVRQEANSRWFNVLKVSLGIYCLSGTDSTRRVNRFFRRVGEAPVVYDPALTDYSCEALASALRAKGYLDATVAADVRTARRRTRLRYILSPGPLYYADSIACDFDNADVQARVLGGSAHSLLHKGMAIDASRLENERKRIVSEMQNDGRYAFNKEFVTFRVDTTSGEQGALLTLSVKAPDAKASDRAYARYRFRHVRVFENIARGQETDSAQYADLDLYWAGRRRLVRRLYAGHVGLRPDSLYRDVDVQRTYGRLGALPAVGYTSVRIVSADTLRHLLDADVTVKLNKSHSISAELEGTNTSGDLGAAVSLSYTNRNLFRGSESLMLKLRGAYEAITGLEGYSGQNYLELNAEATLRFAGFAFPGLIHDWRRQIRATSEISLLYSSQDRPEFHRRLLTAAWAYRWTKPQRPEWSHRYDLLSVNYVFMPWISDTFRENYLEGDDPRYALLRNSYENLLIMKMAYGGLWRKRSGQGTQQLRLGAEVAGNLLQGISALAGSRRNAEGQREIFNVAFSQYARLDIDYARSFTVNERNSFALHTAFGIAIPYGNSQIVPYERRYYAGGANSVRGWSVRGLGPGSYVGSDGRTDFITQTGNLKLLLSAEYRTALFWKISGAAFVDAGNVWTTRAYADQPGGQFRMKTFLREVAVSYGLGLRLNFDYFVLRFDGGMKAIDPATARGPLHYPIVHPDFRRDFTLHFAVGLPF